MKHFNSEHWAFDKRINLSNVITGLTVAISIIWWAAQLEKRIAVLEAQFKAFYELQLQDY
jgi:hypothetical protein